MLIKFLKFSEICTVFQQSLFVFQLCFKSFISAEAPFHTYMKLQIKTEYARFIFILLILRNAKASFNLNTAYDFLRTFLYNSEHASSAINNALSHFASLICP